MPRERLRRQLAVLRARLELDPDNRILRVELAVTARQLARLQELAPALEALPALLTRLAAGELTTDTLGQAISRDLQLGDQVGQAVSFAGAQAGDVAIGEVAGGNIYHIHLGGAHERR